MQKVKLSFDKVKEHCVELTLMGVACVAANVSISFFTASNNEASFSAQMCNYRYLEEPPTGATECHPLTGNPNAIDPSDLAVHEDIESRAYGLD